MFNEHFQVTVSFIECSSKPNGKICLDWLYWSKVVAEIPGLPIVGFDLAGQEDGYPAKHRKKPLNTHTELTQNGACRRGFWSREYL